MTDSQGQLQRRKLPKVIACLTKNSLENMRNKLLFSVDTLDAKGIRRRKQPLHQCLILELKELGFVESSNYLQNLLYDNSQLVAEDDIGIVVDLRKNEEYLEDIAAGLMAAEKEREKENTKKECKIFLNLGLKYSEKGKGILWLAEKFFLAAIAVGSKYLLDGGRLKGVCKYYYAKFLLDKFPGSDPEEAFEVLTEVRDCATGKKWLLYEAEKEGEKVPEDTLFAATALQLWRVLISKARNVRKKDPAKAERLARLAERRARDAGDTAKLAEAIIEVGIPQLMMNNLNNALKTFERAMSINMQTNYIDGICETKMHLAAVMQRLGDHETAARLLTEMGELAMENHLLRQLGRALHLLGELHLRRERPELGTQHLAEAFTCFMGLKYEMGECAHISDFMLHDLDNGLSSMSMKKLFTGASSSEPEMYYEEAEQSRLMMAISAGQELMPSYFGLLKEGRTCAVAKIKVIEWKLGRIVWWFKKPHHDMIPCICKTHNRTPLDILRYKLDQKASRDENVNASTTLGFLTPATEVGDLTNMPDVEESYSEQEVVIEEASEKAPSQSAVAAEATEATDAEADTNQ